jgi:hypothetical protein
MYLGLGPEAVAAAVERLKPIAARDGSGDHAG